MSKKANKTVIGAFVVGAIALLIAGVLIFGTGKFMRKTNSYVLYFQGSIKGLNVGSPVVFRGVKIGSVTDIMLRYDPADLSFNIPVIIEIDPGKYTSISTIRDRDRGKKINELLEKGLRARLVLQSMVTGQLMVDLDIYPDEPLILTGIKNDYPEVPTIPSDMEKLSRTLENIDFEEIFKNISSAVEGLEKFLDSPALIGSIEAAEKALKEIQKIAKNIDNQIKPLVSNIMSTSDAARSAFDQAEKTLALEEGVPGELASDIKETLTSASNAMKQAEHTLSSVQGVVAEDSNTVNELNKALTELSAATRSIRFLADYLERHPEALIRGKGSSKGE